MTNDIHNKSSRCDNCPYPWPCANCPYNEDEDESSNDEQTNTK